MRVLVEAVAADYGGIKTYVDNLLRVWPELFPRDEIHVVGRPDSGLPRDGLTWHDFKGGRPDALVRPLQQTRQTPRLARQLNVDAVLATLPATTLRHPGPPLATVIYDLRHQLRPEQFTRGRRLIRAISYRRGYQVSNGFLAISGRSLADLHQLHPGTVGKPADIAYLGSDHARLWPNPDRSGPAIAFGHHTNKNVDLVLEGMAEALKRTVQVPKILILGASGENLLRWRAKATQAHLEEHVSFSPFLDEQAFGATIARAHSIIFPSDFEGFGLPVVEGMFLGKPVLIGPEAATREVGGGHAIEMASWRCDAFVNALERVMSATPEQLRAAQQHAESFTWARCTQVTRDFLSTLISTQTVANRREG